MSDFPEYLIELDAYTGSGVTTFRFSTAGFKTAPSDTPANTLYDARIASVGTFKRSLFGGAQTLGVSQMGNGDPVLDNADGALDALLTYGVDGRAFVLKRVARGAPYSTAVTLFRGTARSTDAGAGRTTIRLQIYERTLELNQPIQTNRYGGTTTAGQIPGHLADGDTNLKDTLKPLCFGTVKNITPVQVNAFDDIFQVSDGAVQAITVYDGQIPLTFTQDYPTVASLRAGYIPAGKFGTSIAQGLFRVGIEPYFQLTADVVEGASRTAAAVVQRILYKMGISGATNISAASFNALATAAPQELGVFLNGDETAAAAIGDVLASIGGYLLPSATGAYQVGQAPVFTTPTWTLDANSIVDDIDVVTNPDTERGLPVWRLLLNYGRNYTVQTSESVSQFATADRRLFAAAATRQSKVDTPAVQTQYLLAPELTIDTLLVNVADAATEATRRAGLYSPLRYCFPVPVATVDADAMLLGSTGTVTLNRYGWGAGRSFVVIEREDNFDEGVTTLTLWG